MVARADAIIVAEATSLAPRRGPEPYQYPPFATFRRLSALKGVGPEQADLALGFFSGGPLGADQVNPCLLFMPQRGQRYVLFLARQADGSWTILPAAGGDVAAPYGGAKSRWVHLIRDYVAMQKAGPETALRALEADLRSRLRPDADPDAQWRAHHALDYLTGAWPSMPTAHLTAMVTRSERGEPPAWGGRIDNGMGRYLTWSGADQRPWLELLAGVIDGAGQSLEGKDSRRADYALLALVTGHHPDAVAFFQARLNHHRDLRSLIWAIRHLALLGRRAEALDLLERDFELLIFTDNPWHYSDDLEGFIRAMQGRVGPDEQSEAWLQDPAVATRWPKLALVLGREVRGFGDRLLEDIFGRHSRYVPNDQEMAAALATTSNRGVRDWAHAQAAALIPQLPEPIPMGWPPPMTGAQRLAPILLAMNEWPRMRPVVEQIWCGDPGARKMFIFYAGRNARDPFILADLLASTDPADTIQRAQMQQALIRFYAREDGSTPTSPFGPVDPSLPDLTDARLIRDAMAGGQGPGRPFFCAVPSVAKP
ncbi:hypothetical protein C0V82_21715 (plasmid) [Niveispirillum cyanobacteriorum]|uniref:Uncharacterized protein n=2 Tax=Niveispirillum cyanobacteriorum TaxID=1612173 RepID=A0A2K9NIY3_9PROT|nr:hypothetical protein C0V82_21715 [Niveispirillum cyanobacteriorum]